MEEVDQLEEGLEQLVPLAASWVPYVVQWESEFQAGQILESIFLVVMKRSGGLLGALPLGVITDEELEQAVSHPLPGALLGPSVTMMVPGVHQLEDGNFVDMEEELGVLVADFDEGVVPLLSRYLPGDRRPFGFHAEVELAFPKSDELVAMARGYCRERSGQNPPSSQAKKQSRWGWAFRQAKAGGKAKEADHSVVGKFIGGSFGDAAPDVQSASDASVTAGFPREASCPSRAPASTIGSTFGGIYGSPLKAVIYEGGSRFVEKSPKDSPCSPAYLVVSSTGCATGPEGVGGGEVPGGGTQFGASYVGTVKRFDNPGGSDSREPRRPYVRVISIWDCISQRFFGQGKTPAGALSTSGHVLQLGCEVHGEKDEPNYASCGASASSTSDPGSVRSEISGAFRRLRKAEGHWNHPVPADAGFRFHDERQPAGCQRCPGPDYCDVGASMPGWRTFRDCPGDVPDGGPSFIHLHQQANADLQSQGFCTSSRATLGDSNPCIYQRAGPHHIEETGIHSWDQPSFSRWRWPRDRESKVEAKEKGEGKGPGGGGRDLKANVHQGDALELLTAEITFAQWAITLPRFILLSRCPLAWHLRKSFSVCTRSSSSITTAFPLPVPFVDCFRQSGPQLSRKKLLVVGQKRLVHIMVLILNKLYLGRYATVEELRRPPNLLQISIFKRLYGLVAVCGSRPGPHPVPPGRSGPELVASLAVLERFIEKSPEFQNSYVEVGKQAFEALRLTWRSTRS